MITEGRGVENKKQRPYKVLVVEDDETLLYLIQKTLQKAGYSTKGASSGAEAIRWVMENPETLVLLDYLLPDMTGKQVIETLTERGCSVPFIIMTGYGDERIAVEMMKLGARDYLVKDTVFNDIIPSTVDLVIDRLMMEKRLTKAEETVSLEKKRLNDVTDSMHCGLLLLNDQSRVTYSNRIAEEWFGPFDQIKGNYCWELFKLKDPEKECAALEVLQTGNTVRSETFMKTINDKDKYFYVVASPVKDKSGKIHQITEVIIDITERKRAENELKDTQIFLDNIIQSAPDAIITVDLNDLITSFSPSAESMFGYKAEDIIGKSVLKLYPKRQRKKRKRWKEKLLKEEQLERIRTKQVKTNGKTFDVSLSMALLKDAKKRPIGIVGVSHDITDHLKAERDLKKAYKDLKELDRMKAEFLQNVTHELRTPLTAMLTTTRLLKDNVKDERLKEILEVNERSAWRLNSLLGDLLDAGKIERGVFELKLEPVDIRELIGDAMANFQGYATERQLTVEFKLDKGLPKIVADKECIHRAVSNLLDNAIKFNREKGRVDIKASKKNGHVEVSIENTGGGIDEEEQKKVFDRFYQVDGTTKRKYPGTGIGLALAKEIIEMHGGKIWVESKPEEWTKFTFTHPIEMR